MNHDPEVVILFSFHNRDPGPVKEDDIVRVIETKLFKLSNPCRGPGVTTVGQLIDGGYRALTVGNVIIVVCHSDQFNRAIGFGEGQLTDLPQP